MFVDGTWNRLKLIFDSSSLNSHNSVYFVLLLESECEERQKRVGRGDEEQAVNAAASWESYQRPAWRKVCPPGLCSNPSTDPQLIVWVGVCSPQFCSRLQLFSNKTLQTELLNTFSFFISNNWRWIKQSAEYRTFIHHLGRNTTPSEYWCCSCVMCK